VAAVAVKAAAVDRLRAVKVAAVARAHAAVAVVEAAARLVKSKSRESSSSRIWFTTAS